MSFAIVCEARMGEDLGITHLALVDRKICKSLWWTSDDPSIILDYQKESAADFACKRLRKNYAVVVPFHEAYAIIDDQRKNIEEELSRGEIQ